MTAVISQDFPQYTNILSNFGFNVIGVKPYYNEKANPESTHADMQLLKIGSTIALIKNNTPLNQTIISQHNNYQFIFTQDIIKDFAYPDCVKLNIAIIGKYAIMNVKYADSAVLNYLKSQNYEILNTKQGYAKCSAAIVSDEAVITSDDSIIKAVSGKLDCLKIRSGFITLCSRYGGFIGGASFLLNSSVLAFTGDITAHPDCISIKQFCKNHKVDILSLSKEPLCDVGGIVIL